MIKKLTGVLMMIFLLSSFTVSKSLKGTWQFAGGIYNNKKEGAPTDYQMQKKYTATTFESFLIEKGAKPQKYQSGIYNMDANSYTETETFSAQPSTLTGKAVKYEYAIDHDLLTIRATLPTGMKVEEYWRKVK